MKKKMSEKKIIGQELIRVNESIDLYVILMAYFHKQERLDTNETKKQYELHELYKNMKSKYSEVAIPLKYAKLKIDSLDIIHSSKYNMFRPLLT
jgi:hypothetical protein